jgi:hypothetical protein
MGICSLVFAFGGLTTLAMAPWCFSTQQAIRLWQLCGLKMNAQVACVFLKVLDWVDNTHSTTRGLAAVIPARGCHVSIAEGRNWLGFPKDTFGMELPLDRAWQSSARPVGHTRHNTHCTVSGHCERLLFYRPFSLSGSRASLVSQAGSSLPQDPWPLIIQRPRSGANRCSFNSRVDRRPE